MNTDTEDYKQTIEAYVLLIKENHRLIAENQKLNRVLQHYKETIEYLGFGLFDEDEI